MSELIETGEIHFLYRPRVDVEEPSGLDDVQRFYLVLVADDHDRARAFLIGRKRLPDTHGKRSDPAQRDWMLEFLVGDARRVGEAMHPVRYRTRSHGRRTAPEAIPAGSGRYAIERLDDGTRLAYRLQRPDAPGKVQAALGIRKEASYIIAVRNPEVSVEGFPDEKPDYPAELREAFADERWLDIVDTRLLDYENAQLVLIGALDHVDPVQADLDGDADVYRTLGLPRDEWVGQSLREGSFAGASLEPEAIESRTDRGKGGRRGGRAALETDSAAGIARALKGIGFPCRRADLVRHAHENAAAASIPVRLEQIEDREFRTMADVLEALGESERAAGPFRCRHCEEAFATRSERDRHQLAAHPEQAQSAADLTRALSGARMPASREELVEHARKHGEDDAAEVLGTLPGATYRDAAEVVRALGARRSREAKPGHQPGRRGGEQAMQARSAAYMASLFEGLSFPASRDDLKACARGRSRDGDLELVERMPERRYDDMSDVARGLSEAMRAQGD